MPTPVSRSLIRQWGDRLEAAPLARATVMGLGALADEIWRRAFELLQSESPEYRNAVDDDFTGESKAHCQELLTRIIAVAAGKVVAPTEDPFDFVRAHAQWRARHRVPLVASLHAYRIAHRTYSEISQDILASRGRLREVVGAQRVLSEFWIEFFDHVGHVLADAHATEDALIVSQETGSCVRLMDDLLRGVEPADPELRRLCALRGLRAGAPLVVALARPNQPSERHSDGDVALRSLARFFEQALSPARFGALINVRDNQVAAIVCSDGDTGHTVLQALRRRGLAGRSSRGPYIGVSANAAEIARLPDALEEATIAIDFASADQPLVGFTDILLLDLLVRRADQVTLRRVPAWARHLHAAKDAQSVELLRTIRVFADCSFNVKSTARVLGVHTNTVYFRLNRLKRLADLDPRTYAGASAILTSLRLLDLRADARPA